MSLNQPISVQQHLTNNSNIKQTMPLWCLCADRLTYPITKLSCVLCRLPDRLGQPPSAATPVWLHPSPGACMRYNGTSIMVLLLTSSFFATFLLCLPFFTTTTTTTLSLVLFTNVNTYKSVVMWVFCLLSIGTWNLIVFRNLTKQTCYC